MSSILNELEQVLEDRKKADSSSSYVASLYDKGLDQILKKLGEECAETIIAAKNITHIKACNTSDNQEEQAHLIYEASDLIFHLLVLLRHQNIAFSDIESELARRFGLSGIAEKAARSGK